MADDTGAELSKQYDSHEVEQRWYARWSDAGVFRADASKTLNDGVAPYVIMMPPPNVTGTLHNGHALFVTLQDILTRYHRMQGKNALWLPGVDHAGIATQAVVERELKRHENTDRHQLGREAFLERVWAWKEKNGDRIVEQLKVMGASADWTRERFTMDEQCSAAVREAFVRMWNDGLIYRGERLVNWDPASHTALSNEEVDYEERDGELWEFAYKLKDDPSVEMVVATTRPETMLGDTAVAVHPEDERYTDLVGKLLVHPFFPDRHLPIVADDYVDRAFGTGAVKITPAHDPNDFEIGQRHDLEFINILNLDGTINDRGGAFAGQDRFEARKQVKAKLAELELERGGKAIKHNVSISQRSGVPIEPMLSRQYFVSARPLAEMASAAIKGSTVEITTDRAKAFAKDLKDDDKTRILPASWLSTWDHFMCNIRDWCISRQLWWGHRIPVFYDLDQLEAAATKDAETNVQAKTVLDALDPAKPGGGDKRAAMKIALFNLSDDAVRSLSTASTDDLEKDNPDRWMQEDDVLDTWFSSGLWPFSTLGWPGETDDLKAFYPGAVLETGFDILFFWVARMMMMGTYFMGEAPFKDIFLHAMVRDAHGQKMSKSLGNAIDPLDVINGITKDNLLEKTKTYPVPEKNLQKVLKGIGKDYPDGIPASGADGLRFSLAALSGQGRDVKLAIPRVAGYRAFLNKIWNATRFALMRVGSEPVKPLAEVKADLSLADRWILSRLQEAIAKSRKGLDTYRFDETANVIYQFFWTELCDWYIELVKTSLSDDAEAAQREAARSTLLYVLDASMRLLHPLCPFQSEEIWQRLPGKNVRWPDVDFCAIAPYPAPDASLIDAEAERALDVVTRTIGMIRNARQESGLPAQKKVPAIVMCAEDHDLAMLKGLETELLRLALLESITLGKHDALEVPKLSALNADRGVEIAIPLEGLIDIDAEKERLSRELQKAVKEASGIEGRLGNEKFTAKAPPEVVEENRAQLADLKSRIGRLEAAKARLDAA